MPMPPFTAPPSFIPPEPSQPSPSAFGQQIEEARARLGLPATATAWQVMNENAAADRANKDFLRGLFGL